MHEKRQFSSKRLYKLIKWSVIVISILAILNAIMYFFFSYMDQTSCKELATNSDPWIQCMAAGYKRAIPELDTGWRSVRIGILLPVLFFGSVWIYKFLFPVKK